jgi:glucan phosphorylase
MDFDFKAVSAAMLAAMRDVFSADWKKVRATSEKFKQKYEESLQRLIERRLNNEITEEEYEQYLKEKATILQAQIDALKVVKIATTQKAINAALKELETVVIKAIML